MADTIPVDDHVIGDSGHVTDHNDIADVLGLLAQSLTNESSNTSAILALQALQSGLWEPYPVAAYYPINGTSNTARTSTAQVADPYLTVALQSSAIYKIDSEIQYYGGSGGSAGFLQWSWTVPSGSEFFYTAAFLSSATGLPLLHAENGSSSSDYANTTGVSNQLAMSMHGIISTSSTAASLTWNWGCETNSGTNTHVASGSWLTATRIG